ncbi:hypothetical protein BKA69DRAFT_1031798 [Paraphysoderma sedebokerense]|nr:hypothetical protein BKA69DRAFT_1031798 [Paraphysoderma sedebokerense]
MVKLTAELISYAPSYINAVKDRELDLRGHRIPAIENLGATKDQNDTLDLTDNDIRDFTNFPLLTRLRNLLLSNNRISKLDPLVSKSIPKLETLVLTNNQIGELGEIDALSGFRDMWLLSLAGNPVTKKKHYREYVIWRVPSLRVLDFERVKDKERKAARKLFETKSGKATELAKSISATKGKTFEPGEGLEKVAKSTAVAGLSGEEVKKIKEAIRNATSLAEIQRLEEMLQKGKLPVDL